MRSIELLTSAHFSALSAIRARQASCSSVSATFPASPNQSSASGTWRYAPFIASISQTLLWSSAGKASLNPPFQNPTAARGSSSAVSARAATISSRSAPLARSICGFLRNLTGARMTALSRLASIASPRGRNSMVRLAATIRLASTSKRKRAQTSRVPDWPVLSIALARARQPSGSSRGAFQKELKSARTDASSRFQRAPGGEQYRILGIELRRVTRRGRSEQDRDRHGADQCTGQITSSRLLEYHSLFLATDEGLLHGS